jgi:hypothetical protein
LTDQDCIDAGTTGPCTGEAPQCPETCTSITAQVVTDPDDTGGALDELLTAPGQPIELDGSSSFGTCLDGALQFRFSKDAGATVLREFSENPVFIAAPQNDTDYLVEVRCSTDTACGGSASVDVDVDCPSSGNLGGIFATISAEGDKSTFSWTGSVNYMLHQGDLSDASTLTGTQTTGSGTSFTDLAIPQWYCTNDPGVSCVTDQDCSGGATGPCVNEGIGFYYLVREVGEFCNADGEWTSGGAGEQPGRDATLP